MDVRSLGDSPHYIHDSGVLEKHDMAPSNELRAITESGEDSGHKRKDDGALRAYNENTVPMLTISKSKNKRKHSDEIQDSEYSSLHALYLLIYMCQLPEV